MVGLFFVGEVGDVEARGAKSGLRPLRVKMTRVTIDTDFQDIVLEAKAAAKSDTSSTGDDTDSSAPTTADAEASIAEAPLPLDEGKWDPICSAPCERRLQRAALFRITGADITTSRTFTLPPDRPDITLEVKTGLAHWFWTGVIVSAVGGSFLLGGLVPRLALGGSFSTTQKVLVGAGTVMVGVGLPLAWFNRTTVSIF